MKKKQTIFKKKLLKKLVFPQYEPVHSLPPYKCERCHATGMKELIYHQPVKGVFGKWICRACENETIKKT